MKAQADDRMEVNADEQRCSNDVESRKASPPSKYLQHFCHYSRASSPSKYLQHFLMLFHCGGHRVVF